jgi:hypothetical protein
MNGSTQKYYVISTVLQLLHVIVGKFSAGVASLAGPLGVGIPLVIGAWFGASSAGSYGQAATRGFLIGAIPALIGLIVAYFLGSALGAIQPALLVLGTLSSGVAGLVGAVVLFGLVRRRPGAAAS